MTVNQILAIALPICAAFLGVVLSIVWYLGSRIDRRLEALEKGQADLRVALAEGLGEIRTDQAAYAQRLEGHITNHPGPSVHLVGPS
jgi:hypothetical protein